MLARVTDAGKYILTHVLERRSIRVMEQARIYLYVTQTSFRKKKHQSYGASKNLPLCDTNQNCYNQTTSRETKKKAKKMYQNPNPFRIYHFQQEPIKTIYFKTKVIRLNCANVQQPS